MGRQRTAAARRCYHHDLLNAITKCLPHRGLPLQVQDRRVRWTARLLVVCAILLGWAVGPTVNQCFIAAQEAVVALYLTRRRPGGTLAGFLEALERHSARLLPVVVAHLRKITRRLSGRHWRLGPWVVMGADGSRVECPMTRGNEKALGCAGKDKTAPQLFVTTLFHVSTGVPWGWTRGRGASNERKQFRRLVKGLPSRTLLLLDAGYPTYTVLLALMRAGHDFIVRVGSHVRLLQGLGWRYEQEGSTVYLWPSTRRHRPPLMLRLVEVRGERKPVYLLTSVRCPEVLTNAEVAYLYRLRWGVEVMYRTLKRTLEHHKMRSNTPQRAKIELDWCLAGLWMLGLMTLEAMPPRRRLHQQWSAARAIAYVRGAMRNARRPRRGGGLRHKLRVAVQDAYVRRRPKAARRYPRKKTYRPAGRPQTRMATASEVKRAQAVGPLRCPN